MFLKTEKKWQDIYWGDVFIDAFKNLPWTLLGIVALILMFSLMCVHSASYEASTATYLGYGDKQYTWIMIGLMAFLVVQLIPYKLLLKGAPVYYLLGLAALCLVFIIGTKVNGSRRWFSFGSIRVQPSEFMKLALVVMLAQIVGETEEAVKTMKGWILPGIFTIIPFLLVLKQPDLGTALTFVPVFVVAIFVAGAQIKHLFFTALMGILSLPLAWNFVLQDYQKARVTSFLDPETQAKAGAYQQLQSIIGIGSGGVWGKGYEQGTQGRLGFCPERHTDFIFSVVGEEFGLMGGLGLLFIYGILLTLLIRLAIRVQDRQGRLIVAGVATVFAMQVVVNVAMNTGCGPITGLTLPMMSYGGSSMLSSAFALGLVASVARQRPSVFKL
ncbi:MAG: rod shape-determining protein RodA [Planctomycetota bacterium]|nr:rod shape-determining protein RodA [Planctomycetota bacterium]